VTGDDREVRVSTQAEAYVRLALELGAADAVRFDIDDIVFEPRTILKCMFG
jgi:predicted metal-binding protein